MRGHRTTGAPELDRTDPSLASVRVGEYEIVERIGRGGMAAVYLARHARLDRLVALKELAAVHAADPAVARRFVRESRLASAISHPNVATVYGYFEHGGVPYIAMEYLPAGSLRPLVGSLSLAQVLGVLDGVLAGLTASARGGIVHRDLKPENILVSGDGQVKIADFGIAKALDAVCGDGWDTQTGAAVGTIAYMSPEQADGTPVDPRSDLYSVGVIAYELLCGQLPLGRSPTPYAALRRLVDEIPMPLAHRAPDLDARLCAWVDGLLAKRPAARPAGPAEAREKLEDIALELCGPRWRREAPLLHDQPSPAVTAPAAGVARRPSRARRLAVASAAAGLLASAGAGMLTLGDGRPSPAPPPTVSASAAFAPVATATRDVNGRLAALRPGSTGGGALRAVGRLRQAGFAARLTLGAEPTDPLAREAARALDAQAAWAREVEHALLRDAGRLRELHASARRYAALLNDLAPGASRVVAATSPLSAWARARWRVHLELPRTITVTAGSGAVPVRYEARATRAGRGMVVRCRPPSGSSFRVGTTTVHCEAGGTSRTFRVVVVRRRSGGGPVGRSPTPTPLQAAETS